MKMLIPAGKLRYAIIALTLLCLASCKDDEVVIPDPVEENLRTKIDYTTLTASTPYAASFVDKDKKSTVDFSNGNNRYKMFQALNTYINSSISGNKEIDPAVLKGMYANTGKYYADSTKLNDSGVQLRNVTASSWPTANAGAVQARFDTVFDAIALNSKSYNEVAAKGKAGKIGNRLFDAKGIELIQIIQKSFIGALQYDYIANVLLTKGLDADNKKVVSGKLYTQLEQNWDEAYGLLTLNPIYLAGSTDSKRGTTEFALGSYVWEYNKEAYAKIYPAFLKGRAAIVNNDKAELKVQADFIKAAFEKAIAKAAVGYMGKSVDASTSDESRAHALGEGLGFVYSLRFCTINSADSKFSDGLITELIGSPNGYWDLTAAKTTSVTDKITAKFKL
jgi:hypothetical protein